MALCDGVVRSCDSATPLLLTFVFVHFYFLQSACNVNVNNFMCVTVVRRITSESFYCWSLSPWSLDRMQDNFELRRRRNVLTWVVAVVVLQPVVYPSNIAPSSQGYPTFPMKVSTSELKMVTCKNTKNDVIRSKANRGRQRLVALKWNTKQGGRDEYRVTA